MAPAVDEHVFHRSAAELAPFAAWCAGYWQDGVPPTVHRGLPSPWLTLIITLDDPLTIIRHPDPRQPPSQHDTLLAGLHTSPALISHEGRQSGIELRERVSAAPGWRDRFDRARHLLAARYADGQRDFLAGLAADCGYYDQAHLAREFRELAGCPPSAWLAKEFRNIQAGAHDPRE